jgi:hypothetical protein
MPAPIATWHEIAENRSAERIPALLADDVVFRSPAVHTPQEGPALTTAYLTAAVHVLGPTLVYRREWYAERSAVLEFEAELDGLSVHGVDMIAWDDDGLITDFTVMVRPFKGLTKLIELMAAQLS